MLSEHARCGQVRLAERLKFGGSIRAAAEAGGRLRPRVRLPGAAAQVADESARWMSGRDTATTVQGPRRRAFNRFPGVKAMRYIALAEATSFIALLIASFVKRQGDGELGVSILGPIHGVLFLAYCAIALSIRADQGWSVRTTFWILVGAVLPFGGYVVDWWLVRESRRQAA
jgi:integral membrane protein